MESSARQILSNLYGLLMEINFHRSSEDVISELGTTPNARIDKHLVNIRKLTSKYKAATNKHYFEKALEQIQSLKNKGVDELKKLIRPEERAELIPLFRKFEQITESDEASIFEDQELLHLIEVLKSRADNLND